MTPIQSMLTCYLVATIAVMIALVLTIRGDWNRMKKQGSEPERHRRLSVSESPSTWTNSSFDEQCSGIYLADFDGEWEDEECYS